MKESIERELSIHCGHNNDSMETLRSLCKVEVEKLIPSIDVANGKIIRVPCWTVGNGAPELICFCNFSRNTDGKVSYNLDFSESTL